MNINIAASCQEMCEQVVNDLLQLIQPLERPLICPASGSTPVALYKHLVHRVTSSCIDTSNWLFVGLDEWKGMNGKDDGSCRCSLNHQLFKPLAIPEQNICFFDGRSADLKTECQRTEDFIALHSRIDVAIVGLGMNGHIGMNEPGTPLSSRSHLANIHPLTQQVGQKYFSKPTQLDAGLTLGMATILESAHIFLLANGAHKADIVQKVMEGEISEQVPATGLRNHPGLHVFLDPDAARLLK